MVLCDCGRVIDGSRTISASNYVKCSRCRRKPRVTRVQTFPPGVTHYTNTLQRVLDRMDELEAEEMSGENIADFENPWRKLEEWIRSQVSG
jgi:hypothetical protein